jgi:lipoprotein Spr
MKKVKPLEKDRREQFFDYFLAVVIFLCFSGCITPNVRYTRPSRSKGQTKKTETHKRESAIKQLSVISGKLPDSKLKDIVDSYKGIPYRRGGTTRKGLDCSGFVWRVYTELGYEDFKRTSSAKMYKLGKKVSRRKAQPGDLVFFKRWLRINHVGIYMGNNEFIHVSSKKGVIYTSLDDEYFNRKFFGIRRIY